MATPCHVIENSYFITEVKPRSKMNRVHSALCIEVKVSSGVKHSPGVFHPFLNFRFGG